MQLSKLSHDEREVYSWSILDGETIFITGGTGFFGTSLLYSLLRVKSLKEINIQITILTRDIISFSKEHPLLYKSDFIDFINGDIVNFDFPDKKFSRILHMATTTAEETFNGESQLKKYKTLVDGSERVMKLASKCGAKNVLFTSSGVAYGELPEGKVKENNMGAPSTIDPLSALGHGKRSAEFIISSFADKYDINYIIARCFSFIGPGLPLNMHYAVGNFVRDALTKDKIVISGDGSNIRSYMDIRDLVTWILILLSKNNNRGLYNVGSDNEISIMKLAFLVRDIIAPDKDIEVQNKIENNTGNFLRSWYVPNIEKANKDFDLKAWTNLSSSIKYMVEKL